MTMSSNVRSTDDLDTYFLRDGTKVNVPCVELKHTTNGQETVQVRGFDNVLIVKASDGSFLGHISKSDADKSRKSQ